MRIRILRPDEYKIFKGILNRAHHPSFIGRDTFGHNAVNGGAFLFGDETGLYCAALVNPRKNILLVLSVVPEMRGRGLGRKVAAYLNCNFARVIEYKVPFFERCGYQAIGKPKKGRRFKTQIMVKKGLLDLVGRLSRVFPER